MMTYAYINSDAGEAIRDLAPIIRMPPRHRKQLPAMSETTTALTPRRRVSSQRRNPNQPARRAMTEVTPKARLPPRRLVHHGIAR